MTPVLISISNAPFHVRPIEIKAGNVDKTPKRLDVLLLVSSKVILSQFLPSQKEEGRMLH